MREGRTKSPGGRRIYQRALGAAGGLDRGVGAKRGKKLRGPWRRRSGARIGVRRNTLGACVYSDFSVFAGPCHETHLPAKEAQARPDPRLSRPNADARGALDAQATARKGTQAPDGLMPAGGRDLCPHIGQDEDGCRAAPNSTVSSVTAGPTPAVSSCSTCFRAATTTPRRAWAFRCRARSAARSSATASSGCCARPSPARAQRLPAGTDAVVIARQGARELAARDGLAGIQSALGELVDKVPGATVRRRDAGDPDEAAALMKRHAPRSPCCRSGPTSCCCRR